MMAKSSRIFYVSYYRPGNRNSGTYPLPVSYWTTIDIAWLGEKYWFMPGSVVTITDDMGNWKTFIKE